MFCNRSIMIRLGLDPDAGEEDDIAPHELMPAEAEAAEGRTSLSDASQGRLSDNGRDDPVAPASPPGPRRGRRRNSSLLTKTYENRPHVTRHASKSPVPADSGARSPVPGEGGALSPRGSGAGSPRAVEGSLHEITVPIPTDVGVDVAEAAEEGGDQEASPPPYPYP